MYDERPMNRDQHSYTEAISLPLPTAWPIVLALGLSLILAGMVTSVDISLLGFVLFLCSSVGWFRQVLPREQHVEVDVTSLEVPVATSLRAGQSARADGTRRKVLPVESFRITSGITGGLVGGLAMIIPAALFGLLRYGSVWYPANLLAAGGFVNWAGATDSFLSHFHLEGLLAATLIQGVISLLVGLLYGALLPIFPRYPILTAGFLVPMLFSGMLYPTLDLVSPILSHRIDWFWFVLSQIAFGLVCGFVVNLHEKVRTPHFADIPFATRAGLRTDRDDQASASPSERKK